MIKSMVKIKMISYNTKYKVEIVEEPGQKCTHQIWLKNHRHNFYQGRSQKFRGPNIILIIFVKKN